MQRLLWCLALGLGGPLAACDDDIPPTPDWGGVIRDMRPADGTFPPDSGPRPDGAVTDRGPEDDAGPDPDDGVQPDEGPEVDMTPDMDPGGCRPGETSGAPCRDLEGVCAGGVATCGADRVFGECEPPPGPFEADETRCDGLDNDCDGATDEAFPGVGMPCDTDDADLCAYGLMVCNEAGDGAECVDDDPVSETCNGIDDDCDGTLDEDAPDAPPGDREVGVCAGQLKVCVEGEWIEPDYSLVEGYEAGESLCDGLDNDCDGRTDQGLFPPPADRQMGVCSGQVKACGGEAGWLEPDYGDIRRYEAEESSCDGRDNDCDGTVDEGAEPPPCALELGVCAIPVAPAQCLGAEGFSACTYAADYELDEEDTCDALDNDCDGLTDEGPACPVGRRTVRVEPGEFEMGSPPDEPGRQADEARHTVTLTHPMLVRITEVTQAEWLQVMGGNPSARQGADLPVEQVTWLDAVRFANALSRADGLQQCYTIEGDGADWPDGYDCEGWRLPSEAEWEYLARGGTDGIRWTAADMIELIRAAWFNDNSGAQTQPVGTRLPNAFGLHDVLGNVNEWVFEYYGPYPDGAVIDPVGPEAGADRNIRGGAYISRAPLLRSANRAATPPRTAADDIGLRVLRTAPAE